MGEDYWETIPETTTNKEMYEAYMIATTGRARAEQLLQKILQESEQAAHHWENTLQTLHNNMDFIRSEIDFFRAEIDRYEDFMPKGYQKTVKLYTTYLKEVRTARGAAKSYHKDKSEMKKAIKQMKTAVDEVLKGKKIAGINFFS